MCGSERKGKRFNEAYIVFICLVIVGVFASLVYSAVTGNTNQVFKDVVREFTSIQGSNKSVERNMFYIFSISGAFIYLVIYFKRKLYTQAIGESTLSSMVYLMTILATSILTNVIIYKRINTIIISAFLISLLAYYKDKKSIIISTSFFIASIYSIIGIYRGYVFCGGEKSISLNHIGLFALVLTIVLLFTKNNIKRFLHGLLIVQLFIPLTLLIYLSSSYLFNSGEIVDIDIPNKTKLLILLLIIGFVGEVLYLIVSKWKKVDSLQDVLSYGACVCIMAFNRYSGTGAVAIFDFHHTYENVIGYSQIFELGQTPFEKYIPVSGMYSVVHGLFFKLFGNGVEAYYFLATNVFFLFVILLIVFLLKVQLKAEYVLLISLLFLVEDYNRIVLIIPHILILTWPKLIENKNLWLKVWLLTSFLHGLFYPVFGASICIGFFPLGIWQIVTYYKSGKLLVDIKKISFWLWWILCLIPPIAGIKLLIGTAKHMLAMGSQTIYADGLARFGQIIPDNFLSYISNLSIRSVVYLVFSYIILIALTWLSVALALKCGEIKREDGRLSVGNPIAACIALSIFIIFLIAFSYTVVRFNRLELYSRNSGLVKAVFVMLIIILSRYVKQKDILRIWLLSISIFIIAIDSAEAINNIDIDSKLEAYYTVPENYTLMEDWNLRLGKCFMDPEGYQYISNFYNATSSLDRNEQYLGVAENFGLYYFCNFKGISVMEIANTLRGYGAANETIELLKKYHPIVGRNIYSHDNYYLYHWLLTSGEYVWDDESRLFRPNTGEYTKEEVLSNNSSIDVSWGELDLGKTTGSWGSSMKSLNPIFAESDIVPTITREDNSYEVVFDKTIDGDEADYLYLDFGEHKDKYNYKQLYSDEIINAEQYGLLKYFFKKDYNPDTYVEVSWVDNYGRNQKITCNLDEGKLLIPLGARTGWLLNDQSSIKITLLGEEDFIRNLDIKNIRFLKLREAS